MLLRARNAPRHSNQVGKAIENNVAVVNSVSGKEDGARPAGPGRSKSVIPHAEKRG